ncbi:maltose acetyltransferase domain-containing protein [Gordonia sp. VNK21]|uniref:maltose acetyltransferase domain-containing protein n=1 Tax=Gordonia sp. VNK21 TaxID=3382483 RepID=UPI0038D4F21B
MPARTERERMLSGELYADGDPELVALRRECARRMQRFNALDADDEDGRSEILRGLLGAFGPDSRIVPPLRCDYGEQVRIGRESDRLPRGDDR